MADKKPSAGGKSGMDIDSSLVRELAELLNETGLTEIEVEHDDRKIRVARGFAPAPAQTAAASHAPAPSIGAPVAAPAPAPSPASESFEADGDPLRSPMVGTAYLAPEPDKPNFVKIGDEIAEGDTLLIVEAMKVMNPIIADRAGTIRAVLVDNAQPVEFDQPLVIIA